MSDPEAWAYVARVRETTKHHPAGTVVAATVDSPEFAEDNAKVLADWLRDGCLIERVPVEWVRKHLFTAEPYVGMSF